MLCRENKQNLNRAEVCKYTGRSKLSLD